MKALLRLCIFNVAVVWASHVYADDIQDIPPGEDVIVGVLKGESTPFNGQLFDIKTAVRWANWLTQYKEKIEVDAAKSKALCTSELAYQQDISDADIQHFDRANTDLKIRLQRAEEKRIQAEHERDHPAWYTSPWFGVVVGVMMTSGAVYAGSQIF